MGKCRDRLFVAAVRSGGKRESSSSSSSMWIPADCELLFTAKFNLEVIIVCAIDALLWGRSWGRSRNIYFAFTSLAVRLYCDITCDHPTDIIFFLMTDSSSNLSLMNLKQFINMYKSWVMRKAAQNSRKKQPNNFYFLSQFASDPVVWSKRLLLLYKFLTTSRAVRARAR